MYKTYLTFFLNLKFQMALVIKRNTKQYNKTTNIFNSAVLVTHAYIIQLALFLLDFVNNTFVRKKYKTTQIKTSGITCAFLL